MQVPMSSAPNSPSPSSPPLMSLSGAPASLPFEVTIAEAPVEPTKELDANKSRHTLYYFEDGNVVFLIEDTLYNVHRYFFARDSSHFRTILKGTDASHPCVMSDVSCEDFDEFLAILYPTDFRRPTEKNTAQWTSILHLAAKWGFENIKLFAIDNLTANATPIDKIVLGRRYGIIDWLPRAYEAVCTRADPLTLEEGIKLGVEDTVRISAARQVYGISKARFEAKYLAGDLEEIFKLEKPSEGSVTSMDDEEHVIKVQEERVAAAQMEYLANPTPPVGACMNPTSTYNPGDGPWYISSACGSCGGCKPESDEQKRKREAKEGKERELGDLKSRLEQRRQELAGREQRMESFM
ncbi:hypothetical protein FIBSPDRAFT_173855 [Athelia psychrophila]|uniref:BTB domain-containing protein n=1 Tax=Athelia psychrophila TaxID=1759441 RepID=A0A166AQ17_9AGAM|nr:hypothetical protein FIBSPDRAFT_173855 [Fibularhizoctonia sp. CBS 109695]